MKTKTPKLHSDILQTIFNLSFEEGNFWAGLVSSRFLKLLEIYIKNHFPTSVFLITQKAFYFRESFLCLPSQTFINGAPLQENHFETALKKLNDLPKPDIVVMDCTPFNGETEDSVDYSNQLVQLVTQLEKINYQGFFLCYFPKKAIEDIKKNISDLVPFSEHKSGIICSFQTENRLSYYAKPSSEHRFSLHELEVSINETHKLTLQSQQDEAQEDKNQCRMM